MPASHDGDDAPRKPASVAGDAAPSTTADSRMSAAPGTRSALPYDGDQPKLPDEPVPEDDGWSYHLDEHNRWYFYNRFTKVMQWENPRVPEATATKTAQYARTTSTNAAAQSGTPSAPGTSSVPTRKWGGYNPAIHGNWDPNADYAKEASKEEEEREQAAAAAAALANPQLQDYSATAQFNRFTGKFQQASAGPDMHNDENKSKRQMNAFFDVEAAANSHDGRSLKAERRNKTLSKKELHAYKEKRRDKKETKRRAWLLD